MADYILTGGYFPTAYWPALSYFYWPLAGTGLPPVIIGVTGGDNRLQLTVYQSAVNLASVGDWSRVVDVETADNEHGHEYLSAFLPLSAEEIVFYYEQTSGKHLVLTNGGEKIFEGRIEDRDMQGDGLRVQALGYWRAASDLLYTGLWNDTRFSEWQELNAENASGFVAELFELDNNNRLWIAPRKNEVFSSSEIAAWGYEAPHQGERGLFMVAFEYEFVAASPWKARFHTRYSDWSVGATPWSLTGTGATQVGVVYAIFSGSFTNVTLSLFYDGAATTYSGETGDTYIKITRLRLCTTSGGLYTTSTGAITAGSAVVITPASMTGIYVGQTLYIGGVNGEAVTVTAVSATTFTADFVRSHSLGVSIQAPLTYADEIVESLITYINSINSTQLSSLKSLVESPGLDLRDEIYEDMPVSDILNKLVSLGDNQSPPRQWEVGVLENRWLYFRPIGSQGRQWYVDVVEMHVNSTLDTLINSAYAVYRDENGRTRRTAVSTDAESVAEYGITRRGYVSSQSSLSNQAETHRNVMLEDNKRAKPQSRIVRMVGLFDATGTQYPLWACRSGDTLTIRNLPPGLSADIDKIRSFRVKRRVYRADSDTMVPTPEMEIPSLEFLVARQSEGF